MNGFWQQLSDRLLSNRRPPHPIARQARIVDYSIVEMAALFRSGELTCEQITLAYLERIDQLNGPLETYDENGGYNAFVRIDRDTALEQARAADQWIASANDPRGPAPLLCGIPLGIKDSIAIEGLESKNGTHLFSGNIAHKHATVVQRLVDQGAVILGHTICSELSGSINGDFGCNAWDITRAPGGSSSGSAIAPVLRLCAATLGEETAGSIVIPAAANGASAIKPSSARVPNSGVMPLTMGWDVVGPMARSVADAALIFAAISGPDPEGDALSLGVPSRLPPISIQPSPGAAPLEGIVIGIPQTDWMFDPGNPTATPPPAQTYDQDYREAFERFKGQLRGLGAQVIEIEGLDLNDERNCPYVRGNYEFAIIQEPYIPVSPVKATSYCLQYEANFWGAVLEFAQSRPDEVRAQLERLFDTAYAHPVPEQLPYAMRLQAENLRREHLALWQASLDAHDVDFLLVMPLGSHVGKRQNQEVPIEEKGMQVRRNFHDLPNGLGLPVVTFPIGYGRSGVDTELPINAAFWGPRFSEARIIQAAIDFQHHYPEYHNAAPDDVALRPAVRAPAQNRVWPVTPRDSNDPRIIEQAGRRS
jgi:Asp-tRNA(Asn)/Glu-tRNA(Gln) amidotransferase A subunit family amidase